MKADGALGGSVTFFQPVCTNGEGRLWSPVSFPLRSLSPYLDKKGEFCFVLPEDSWIITNLVIRNEKNKKFFNERRPGGHLSHHLTTLPCHFILLDVKAGYTTTQGNGKDRAE